MTIINRRHSLENATKERAVSFLNSTHSLFSVCILFGILQSFIWKMYRSISSLLTLFIFTIAALGAAIPSRLEPWSTPVTCLRELAEYDFRRCSADLSDLIRIARDSLAGIELIGMRLIDVVGPGSVSKRRADAHSWYLANMLSTSSQYCRTNYQ